MRVDNFNKNKNNYARAHFKQYVPFLIEDIKTEIEAALNDCVMKEGNDLFRAQGEVRCLKALLEFLELEDAAPATVVGISEELNC